jgi:hypothetical protein
MIKNKDRSRYFGASDTSKIVGNWNTKTFMELYLIKLGVTENNFSNTYLMAGNAYERRIAQSLDLPLKFDRCIKIPTLRLRVNLDAETKDCIYEIKTHKHTDKAWKMPIGYWQQCQVQMFATGKHKCKLVAYPMTDANYENFFLEVDKDKVEVFDIEYDEQWINTEYLPRLKYLAKCLKHRKTPNYEEFLKEKQLSL